MSEHGMTYLWAYLVGALLVAGVTIVLTHRWNREEPSPDPLIMLAVDGLVLGALWPLLLIAWFAFEIGGRIYVRDDRPPDE